MGDQEPLAVNTWSPRCVRARRGQRQGGTTDDLWERRWPRPAPLSYVLRAEYADQWVRFHSLPESKRYAENETEYDEILLRHRAVLRELQGSTGTAALWVIAADWVGGTRPPAGHGERCPAPGHGALAKRTTMTQTLDATTSGRRQDCLTPRSTLCCCQLQTTRADSSSALSISIGSTARTTAGLMSSCQVRLNATPSGTVMPTGCRHIRAGSEPTSKRHRPRRRHPPKRLRSNVLK